MPSHTLVGMRGAALALALAAGLGGGCVRLTVNRESRFAPVDEGSIHALVPGESDLSACLAALGAPLWVGEHPIDGTPGALLAWGWYEARDVGLRFSYSFGRGATASFDYDQMVADMEGVVLVFDQAWTLVSAQHGLLRDLTDVRALKRPASLEDEPPAAGG